MSNQQLAKKTEPEFILDTDQAHEKELVLKNEEKSKIKVDINTLMDRVREEKKKEKKENLIFVSLIASVILITGAIASF